ncbi:MAG TPA: hypothetical protein VD978_11835 [Azospirillum sp.]|nr:hypothetical protein [Azospirillum sp.]
MDAATRHMVEDAYQEATQEALGRGLSRLTSHKEGVVAAAMLLSAITGQEDEDARAAIVSLNLRPAIEDEA